MERRVFLRAGAYGITAVAVSGSLFGFTRLLAPVVEAPPTQRIPLPGALADENEFIAACIGCGLCGEVCPPRCILFYKRSGANALNTPFINPEYKGCILCGKCMEVCPTNALAVIPAKQVKMGLAHIDRDACYPWVDRGVCGACVSICPIGESAIGFDFANIYRPVIKNGCVGCGLCVEICPEPSLPIRVSRDNQKIPTRFKSAGYT